jgi:hypothetical protein
MVVRHEKASRASGCGRLSGHSLSAAGRQRQARRTSRPIQGDKGKVPLYANGGDVITRENEMYAKKLRPRQVHGERGAVRLHFGHRDPRSGIDGGFALPGEESPEDLIDRRGGSGRRGAGAGCR